MPAYTVTMQLIVSTTVEVEADNPEAAIEAAYQSDNMPSTIGHGAFGQASVDEAGEWEPNEVYEGNAVVWAAPKD